MKTLTLEQIIDLKPCWLDDKEQEAKLYEIGERKTNWNALDILKLSSDEVSSKDKFWLVLREEFIDACILHEFACRCVEQALAQIENPDPLCIAAIEAKRKWLRGEINDDELKLIKRTIPNPALKAIYGAAYSAVCDATCYQIQKEIQHAAWAATLSIAKSTNSLAALSDARCEQVQILINLLEEA